MISNKSKSDNAAFDGGCWVKPRFKRLVVVLIDALRDDFARFDEAFQNTVSAGASAGHRLKEKGKKRQKEQTNESSTQITCVLCEIQ